MTDSRIYPVLDLTPSELIGPKEIEKANSSISMLWQISSKIWVHKGFSASYKKPWFEKWPSEPAWSKRNQLVTLAKLMRRLEKSNIDLSSYAKLTALITNSFYWTSLGKLFARPSIRYVSWMRKLKKECSSARFTLEEFLDYLAVIAELQIETLGKVTISEKQVGAGIRFPDSGLCFAKLHHLVEKFYIVRDFGADIEDWIELKVRKIKENWEPKNSPTGGKVVWSWGLGHIVSDHLDPMKSELLDLKSMLNNPWIEIIRFLGFHPKVSFSEGYIPKGFGLSLSHNGKMSDIESVYDNGRYSTWDGSSHMGSYHYDGSAEDFCIKVTPENFHLFQDEWFSNMEYEVPTWEEMKKWGIDSSYWDENGDPINSFSEKVKWRKLKKEKESSRNLSNIVELDAQRLKLRQLQGTDFPKSSSNPVK